MISDIFDHAQFEQRKQDHIELALMQVNQAEEHHTLDSLVLRHEALPDLDFDKISIGSLRLGVPVVAPFLVASMTAGHEKATQINKNLMAACHIRGWAMGVGSQRREITDPGAADVWKPLRARYPEVTLFSNLGIAQVITTQIASIQSMVDSIAASALIVHCNPLQECMQPEGTPFFQGSWKSLENLVRALPVPVVIKETGCGFSTQTLQRLNNIGIAAVDVSGLGGTHWGRIEGHRATQDMIRKQAAVTFRHWGIDTLSSVKAALALKPDYEVWGSGGVRHGLDAAKLFALGVKTVAFAKPILQAALTSEDAVIQFMYATEYELKVAMFCTGSQNLMELREKVCPM
jgi:isopentenyl-diphosphate delta-isomerase